MSPNFVGYIIIFNRKRQQKYTIYFTLCFKLLTKYIPKYHIFQERIAQVLLMHKSQHREDKGHPSNRAIQTKHDIQLARNLSPPNNAPQE